LSAERRAAISARSYSTSARSDSTSARSAAMSSGVASMFIAQQQQRVCVCEQKCAFLAGDEM
jgi:hypothetical protein